MLRRLSSLLVATVATATLGLAAAGPAYAGPGESQFTSLTNSARRSNGQASYRVAGDLISVARRHSADMARKHDIWHNPNLANDVSNWRAVGENVGMGPDVQSIHNAFMASQHHRDNILDRDFTEVGIGTATDENGTIYVTEVFRQPMSSSTAPPPPAAARPVSRSAPAVTPQPRRQRIHVVRGPAAPVAPAVDQQALLRARLAGATARAAKSHHRGAVPQAMSFLTVVSSL